MNKDMRRAVIAGNWKMNKNQKETRELLKEILPKVEGADCDVIVCVPFTDLQPAVCETKESSIQVGAQNCHFEKAGAFTGEISADMLVEMGVTHVILGHSERRQYFGETDETVRLRLAAALEAGLTAIVCVGEQLQDRENGVTEELVSMQMKTALFGVKKEQIKRVIIAYEPIWAIGTGKTATAQEAQDVCAFLRKTASSLYGQSVADRLTILYGGSMNAKNASDLLGKPDVDGGLIGGASLKAEDFAAIVKDASLG